jgi:recombination protein RecA
LKTKQTTQDAPTVDAKQQAREVVDALNKVFGKNTLRLASDNMFTIKRISTGSYTLDSILGGGVAQGRIIEFYGNYSTCKTLLALSIIKSIQKINKRLCLYINVEDTFDPIFAKKIGVDLDLLVIQHPQVGEDVVNFLYESLKSGAFGGIILDSIAALLPAAEANSVAEKQHMGLAGKLTSSMMRKAVSGNRSDTTLILINQIRDKVGVMFGKKETTPGGRAVSFFASQRIELRKGELVKEGKGKEAKTVGRVIHVHVEKDKTAPNEGKSTAFTFLFRKSRIDKTQEIINLGLDAGLVTLNRGTIVVGNVKYRKEAFGKFLKTAEGKVLVEQITGGK